MVGALSALWPRFQRLSLWTRVVGWLVLWPLLVPLWLLAGPTARWRQIGALGSFVVLGFFWSAMRVGAFTDVEDDSPAPTADRSSTASATAERSPTDPTSTPTADAGSRDTTTTQTATVVDTPPMEASVIGTSAATAPAAQESAWVATRIVDGDTLEVQAGDGTLETIRVVGVDTPERGQCGFDEAADALARMVFGQTVELVPGAQDERDRYGRLLRYVDVQGVDAGLELIKGGFATARYDSRDGYGRHPREDDYVRADAASLPICEAAPTSAPTQPPPPPSAPPPPPPAAVPSRNCDPSYPDVCIPPYPPDLDCGEIPFRRFRVLPPDPHGFDGRDNDGLGCES